MYIFGGHPKQAVLSRSINKKEEVLNDLWKLDIQNNRWVRIKPSIGKPWPEARYFHSAVPYKNKLIIFGGHGESSVFSNTWAFDAGLINTNSSEHLRSFRKEGMGTLGLYKP
jgi:hypothetical protein